MAKKPIKFLSLLCAFFGAFSCCGNAQNVSVVEPSVFKRAIESDSNAVLIDVRKPEEFAAGHIQGAKLMNWLDADNFKEAAKGIDTTKTVFVYCRSGRRSNAAAWYLSSQGYTVVDLKGGILAWNLAGYETVKNE